MFSAIDWTTWGAALIVLFPLLIILLGEFIYRLDANGHAASYAAPLSILTHGVLPLAFVDIVLRRIVGLPGDHLAVMLADTGLSIVALNAAVALFNILFFREGAQIGGRMQIPKLLLDLLRFFFVVCGGAVIVSTIWDVNLSSLITALGVGSVVIGLALQDTLGSLFAGIAMVSARQFRVGDWIRFEKQEGLVLAMNWRSVKVRTRAGDALYLPNGIIARQTVTVLAGGAGTTTVTVEFKFPYDTSPDKITGMLAEAARVTSDFHLEPAPSPRVVAFDDAGIRYTLAVRVLDPQKLSSVRSEFLSNVWYLAQRRSLPFQGQFNADFQRPQANGDAEPAGPELLARLVEDVGAFRVGRDQLRRLVRNAHIERYRAGEAIVEQGRVADHALVLVQGRARAIFASPAHADVQLHEFERGQVLMAKSLFQANATPFSFKAGTEIEAVAIPVADFKELCLSDTALARDIEQILSAREDAANRALSKAFPNQDTTIGHNDRVQLMREMFRS